MVDAIRMPAHEPMEVSFQLDGLGLARLAPARRQKACLGRADQRLSVLIDGSAFAGSLRHRRADQRERATTIAPKSFVVRRFSLIEITKCHHATGLEFQKSAA